MLQSLVWGCAYEVSEETALPYLTNRECKLGGYMTKFTTFFPRDCKPDETNSPVSAFTVMLYIATPKNDLWLGDAPLHEIANQITECQGSSGHNVEYLLRLADYMRDNIPEAVDEHLFNLEYLVRSRIKQNNLSIKSLMGDAIGLRTFNTNDNINLQERENHLQDVAGARVDSFQYAAKIPEKILRCLNI